MYGLTDYGWMLGDPSRIEAYSRALASLISPHTVAADLGAGIGTFSIIAAQLGAARVYAIEPGGIIAVAEENARRSRVADRIRFIRGRVSEITLPEKASVIVSDLSGALPLFEEHIPAVMHARDHFLAPGGTLIPSRARLFCAPVSSAELYSRITAPWRSLPDIDLSAAETMALNTPRALPVTPGDLFDEPRCWGVLDYATITSPNVSASIGWTPPSKGVVHGFALWFESTLAGDITIASGPWSPRSVHATMLLPLLVPLETEAGDDLQLTIDARLISGSYVVTWHARNRTHSGSTQSTFFSQPIAIDSLQARSLDPIAATTSIEGTWKTSSTVLSRPAGDGLMLLDLASGDYHHLNGTGARIWRSLSEGNSIDGIVDDIVSKYEIDSSTAASDVQAILARLNELHLISALNL
ncbi:MAG: type protein arginine methyltransferase [Thermoanaerobaculia bacterium]|jgi:hypothetical protein|nr:type protein arginine methyltransferase [Thermoanaerobaculia bacterium]